MSLTSSCGIVCMDVIVLVGEFDGVELDIHVREHILGELRER